jgi:alcohol dehydrogenase class IV
VDALSHVVEGYLSKKGNLLSDALALEAIRAFGQTIPALTSRAVDLAVREQLLYISLLGGVVIAQSGTTMVHSLGYSLTYFRNIPHGRANGLLLTEYLRFLEPAVPDKISSILKALDIGSVDALADLMMNFLGPEPPLSAQETEEFSKIAIQAANIGNTPRIPDIEDLKDVLRSSLSGA